MGFKQFQNAFILIRPAAWLYEAMVFQRIDGHLPVVFAQFDEPLSQPHYILKMNIYVNHAVAYQQGPLQAFGMVNRRTFGISQAIGVR